MSDIDPAAHGGQRIAAPDMFSPANGFDRATGQALGRIEPLPEPIAAESGA